MSKTTIYFANGDTLEVREKQHFIAVNSHTKNNHDNFVASETTSFELWMHVSKGLTPSIYELLFNADYFYDIDYPNTHYHTQAIVKIEKSPS